MRITRRSFLGCAAGTVATGLPFDLWRAAGAAVEGETGPGCVLLDLSAHGWLRESVRGYESALNSLGTRFLRHGPQSVSRCAMLIVPGAVEIPPMVARAMVDCLDAGTSVILESGAGFAGEPECRAHRAVLRELLHVETLAPLDLWAARPESRGLPYVDYTWPHPARLRDFSRVVPVLRQPGEIIAWVDGRPVALKRRSGRGTLIFLGSPLGPALWAGDREARRWLSSALRAPL